MTMVKCLARPIVLSLGVPSWSRSPQLLLQAQGKLHSPRKRGQRRRGFLPQKLQGKGCRGASSPPDPCARQLVKWLPVISMFQDSVPLPVCVCVCVHLCAGIPVYCVQACGGRVLSECLHVCTCVYVCVCKHVLWGF